MNNHFAYFTLLFLFLFSLNSLAQSNSDSIKAVRHTELKHFKDSIYVARMKMAEKVQKQEDSIKLIKKQEKIRVLNLQNPDTTVKIEMINLGMIEMPDISRFAYVKRIDFHHNKIEKIPKKTWPKSDSLQSINLENNELHKIYFKKNNSIKNLSLSTNHFKKIPRSVRKLKQLKSLDLSHNKIKRIPFFIKKMDCLEEIILNYNQLNNLSEREIKRLKKLTIIHVGSNGLTKLPENINILNNVNTLNFGENHLSSVPASFAQLDSLEHLIFYRNDFDSIPQEILELKTLKELDFYYNHIKIIPEGIGNLTKLQQLFIAFNEIDRIPDTVFSLRFLKALYLHHNKLIIIPDAIVNMDELMYLDLGYNLIFDDPDMSGMKSLREVDIQENNLAEFPFDILENKNLTHIYLMGNTFVLTKQERANMEKLQKELLEMGIRFYF